SSRGASSCRRPASRHRSSCASPRLRCGADGARRPSAYSRGMTDRELRETYPYWFAGEPVEGDAWLDVDDKFTRCRATRVARADAAVVDEAIGAAVDGFRAFRAWPAWRRAEVLRHVAKRIAERDDELAKVLVVETGKPLSIARGEVLRAIDTFSVAAEEATRIRGEH